MWINVWLKPPLDLHLVRVLRGITINGSRCVLSVELLWVGSCFIDRWLLWFLTVYKSRTKSVFGFQAPVVLIVSGSQELEKSVWFSRFGSRIVKSGACVGISVGEGVALGIPVENPQGKLLPHLFGSSIFQYCYFILVLPVL